MCIRDSCYTPSGIGRAWLASHEFPFHHPIELMREAAALPLQCTAEVTRPHLVIGCLGERDQDLILGFRQTRLCSQTSRQVSEQMDSHGMEGPPRVFLALVQPDVLHAPILRIC